MLSYALAIVVAVSSLILFSTAFLMSDIHRQDDFFWSGVGLIYALVLWFCARNITGAVLLGQTAAVAVLVSSNWQTLKLRKAIAHPEKAAELNNFSVLRAVNDLLSRKKSPAPAVVNDSTADKVVEQEVAIPEQASPETAAQESENQVTTNAENASDSQDRQANAEKNNQSGLIGKLFGRKKQVAITDTKLDEVLEEKGQEQVTVDKADDTTPVSEEKTTAPAENVDQVIPVEEKTVAQVDTQKPTEDQEVELAKQTEIIEEKPENQAETITSEVTSSDTPLATKENQLEEKIARQDHEDDVSPSSEVKVEDNLESEIAPPSQPEVKDFSDPEITSPQASEATQTTETTSIQSETAENNQDESPTIAESEVKSVAENNPVEVKENIETIDSKSKESPLDSLETVEVAEVLEAVPEDISTNQNDDQSNIIEVTTTEINIATESTKTDHKHDHDFGSEGSKDS
ncbi:Ycf66 family protein [Pleurocapsa sp. PCC 7319]|uniref:Ycf66 family protein n=1 Tax=Pleurocapsa sp. PCC 7319 TaxID=118161 RepID=UPI00034621A2|nr:Ycf66 family protein [Pleurocapsa sp. PCC 7319]